MPTAARKKAPTEPRDQPMDRAFAVLSALAGAARPMSMTELAELCGMPVPTMHRLAAQLEARGLVKRAFGSKKLLVGPALVQLGAAATEAALHSDPVHRILVALAAKLGEPCQIGVRAGNEVVYADAVRAARSAGLHVEQGRHAPIHCSSIGKIFLAEMPVEQFELWLESTELPQLTPYTITSPAKLKAVVNTVRKNGWAAVGVRAANRLARGLERAGLLDLRLERLRKSDHVNPLADHDQLTRVAREAGFEIERITYYTPVAGAFVENVLIRLGERWLGRRHRVAATAAPMRARTRSARPGRRRNRRCGRAARPTACSSRSRRS